MEEETTGQTIQVPPGKETASPQSLQKECDLANTLILIQWDPIQICDLQS